MYENENKLVDNIWEVILGEEISTLVDLHKRKNLATSKDKALWSKWWRGELPPQFEPDLIPVFKWLEKAILIGIEVKYARPGYSLRICEGFEQAMSYTLMGFDGVAVWQIFDTEVEDFVVESYAKALHAVKTGFDLPIFSLVTKIEDPEEMTFSFFEEYGKSTTKPHRPGYYLIWIRNTVKNNRNPLLSEKKIQNRRKLLKNNLNVIV
ncbi:MAG: hypothetical protein GWO20_19290 [Candidatus Korarchaeota archaeon]|nr:hypothetical protein [Candidatus Korarchaeota archaeon]NIU85398.1 hypothetical protein [Candidatus Thorarchaeota archaeon]NIW15495.1 hypothetical protein [Candidatus Thorarchaeota archaeon]NIW53440.1 hypothetical protein [Candidatus Korarchaeota archaeon]